MVKKYAVEQEDVDHAKELIRFFTKTLIPDLKETYGSDGGYVRDFKEIVKVLKALSKGDVAAANKAVSDYGGAEDFAERYLIQTIGADTDESGMEGTADDLYESAHVILNLLGVHNRRLVAGSRTRFGTRRNPRGTAPNLPDYNYILEGEGDDEQYFSAGTKVVFRGKKNDPGKGLSYAAGEGVLAEDARSGGWDVYDLTDGRSIYGFSIEHAAPTAVRPRAERALGPAARPTPKKVMGYAGKRMRKNPTSSRAMVRGYMEAALYFSTDDDGTPLDRNFTDAHFSDDAEARMEKDCADFLDQNADDIEDFVQVTGRKMTEVGHDFWLTRNRHGTGFWDRGAGEVGARLTEAAHAFGECNIYVNDVSGRLSLDVG